MINTLTKRIKNAIYIILPIAVAIYLIYPLLAGHYWYPVGEYELYKSFMVNFIGTLKKGILLTYNQYVGAGHPAMYFGHYPISQNTIFYMLFGFNDFTYYLTKLFSLIILFFTFIYACKFLRLSYWIALLGALAYFSVNFVIRVFVAETIGNLVVFYPLLIIFIIKIIREQKIRDILIFSLFYIFWLSGGHILYVYMHLIMLSIIFWVAIFVFYKSWAFKLRPLKKFIKLYFILFVIPFLAVLYQYYFIYDVIAASNRLKGGLIVSPFNSIAWKQLITSFGSSAYFWTGLFLVIIYATFKLLSKNYDFIKTKTIRFSRVRLLVLIFLILFSFPEKTLLLLRIFRINYIFTTLSNGDDYVMVKNYGKDILPNGSFSQNTDGWTAYLATLSTVENGRSGHSLKITAPENATGYAYCAIPTKPGQIYRVSAFYRKASAADGQIKVGTSVDDTSLYYSGILSDTDWTQYSGLFKAATQTTYITLVNLTSTNGQSSYFNTVRLYKLEPAIFSDFTPILKSVVFKISLLLFFLLTLVVLYNKNGGSNITFPSMLYWFFILMIYISLLSYYFYSPENIIGDVNGYDYDLFKELSIPLQIIFNLCVLNSIKTYRKNKAVKITVLSLVVLYLIRSHLTLPLLRFTGIVWYATRDGSIFSFLFAILFMFGLRQMLYDLSGLFKNKSRRFVVFIRYCLLILLLILLSRDSYHKFYKGTSHRFIYGKDNVSTPMEQWILDGKKEAILLEDKLLSLNKLTSHFYRTFTPENHYLYLAGITQRNKIHEAVIYESSISRELYDFYTYTILEKKPSTSTALKNIMPYFLFTKHVHAGLGLQYRDILYSDFFIFNPKNDTQYLLNQNIEFLWDLMQVKYLIIGPEFSKVLANFSDYNENYKFLYNYPKLNLSLYQINKNKSYSQLAVYPLEGQEDYKEAIAKINSKDVQVLKNMYSKLLFLDQGNKDFNLLKDSTDNNSKRYYEINAKIPGILIDFESWNRNWRLKINNKDERLEKAFQIFKGIQIRPGINQIKLTYNLKYFKGLFFLSLVIILIYVVLLIRVCVRGGMK